MKEFTGKNAFITGGASGIGLGMARAFAAEGVNIVLADIEPEVLSKATDEIRNLNVQVMALKVDVSDRSSLRDAAAAVERELGCIHLLCNNAGVAGPVTKLHETSEANWDWTVGVNFMGVVNGLQTFLPTMLEHGEGSHIINTSSIAGIRRYPGLHPMALYATTKFAVVGLSETLATEMEDTQIGVSVLCPDSTQSNLFTVGRNRPQSYGGAYENTGYTAISTLLEEGLTTERLGARIVDAVKADEFYIFSHSENRAQVEARHDSIIDGFENLDRWLSSHPD